MFERFQKLSQRVAPEAFWFVSSQVFVDALSVVSCVVLKGVMKRDYNLSPEQCATFNPRDIRQERIGRFNGHVQPRQGGGPDRLSSAQQIPLLLNGWRSSCLWWSVSPNLLRLQLTSVNLQMQIRGMIAVPGTNTKLTPWKDDGDVGWPCQKASPRGRGRGQAKKQEKKKGRRSGTWSVLQ